MSTTYTSFDTIVVLVPGPSTDRPVRWAVQHRCMTCRDTVQGDQLIAHASMHGDEEPRRHPSAWTIHG